MRSWKAVAVFTFAVLCVAALVGCASYRGGKVIDGTNLEVGMAIPGTDWSINLLSYTGGAKVCGNDNTYIAVTNCIAETNSYFGVITTRRYSCLWAEIEPRGKGAKGDGEETPDGR